MAAETKRKYKKRYDEEEDDAPTESPWSSISNAVRKSIAAVLLLVFAVILFLAVFDKAGPVGEFIYDTLNGLFGWGYYLLPLVSISVALIFLLSKEVKFIGPSFIGALILIFSSMSLIDVISPDKAGLIGNLLGTIEIPFGKIAGGLITGALIIVGSLITLNAPLKLRLFKKDHIEIKGESLEENPDPTAPETEKKSRLKITEALSKAVSKSSEKNTANAISNPTLKNYVAPPLSLLNSKIEKPVAGDLRANANTIKRTLESFGIPVDMGEINIGPKVTRYTLKPAEGIKLTRITALNQDLALALAAHPLRIEAPIPGKSLVGIEVPNKTPAIVHLGSLLAYPEFSESSPLSIVIGRDVNGEPVGTNIEKMPHLLVSGSTGSGKSILVHAIITSLLFKNSPEILKFVMIDPKRVELSIYNNIPHLVSPVITLGKKSANVFRWAIQEMENRYETLLKAGARDITSYNSKSGHERMPYLIIVVDELADLMATYGREIESAIVRLAQMARATGIHLILATQRPSVEVITGLIKANITSRVALQVASQIDSRTILDTAGAEKLLGGGDMLFVSSEYSKPKRIQGAFISEKEINSVAKFIVDNNQNNTESEKKVAIETHDSNNSSEKVNFDHFESDTEEDDLLPEAMETVRQAKKASASLLQRRLKVGYARAARLLDIMEDKGIIGPGDGAKPREVYLSEDDENNKNNDGPLVHEI